MISNRVLFDATPLARAHASRGIGAVCGNLLRALAKSDERLRPHLLTTTEQTIPSGFQSISVSWPSWRLKRLPDLWPRLRIERRIQRERPALFHATQHELIPDGRRVRTVATCYDLIPLHYRIGAPPHVMWARRNLERLRHASLVCCGSQATANDLVALLDIPWERIRVTPFAAPPQAAPFGDTPRGPYLLYSNSIEPHKNPRLAIEALSFSGAGIDLVVTGTSSPALLTDLVNYAAKLGVGNRIHWLGHVSGAQLAALRRDALAAVVTSHIEGFGLPVLEALEAGLPTLVADTSALVEVGGHAVTVLSLDDPEAWGRAIDNFANHPEDRPAIAEIGRAHAATYSWQRTAALTRAAWDEVLATT